MIPQFCSFMIQYSKNSLFEQTWYKCTLFCKKFAWHAFDFIIEANWRISHFHDFIFILNLFFLFGKKIPFPYLKVEGVPIT